MEETGQLRRGPWTAEEDASLASYVPVHGEGRWESVARGAGMRRTGKSCRLRWLNYLRPDVRRGNITAEEQLLILQLHSRWGNRWSKIAEHIPGRTDNEIKNYWRTRVQKHARSLRCDPNSRRFHELINQMWVPRLLEKIGNAVVPEEGKVTTTTSPESSSATTAAFEGCMPLSSSEDVTSDGFDSNWSAGELVPHQLVAGSTDLAEERLPESGQAVWEEACDGFLDSWSCNMDELWSFLDS